MLFWQILSLAKFYQFFNAITFLERVFVLNHIFWNEFLVTKLFRPWSHRKLQRPSLCNLFMGEEKTLQRLSVEFD